MSEIYQLLDMLGGEKLDLFVNADNQCYTLKIGETQTRTENPLSIPCFFQGVFFLSGSETNTQTNHRGPKKKNTKSTPHVADPLIDRDSICMVTSPEEVLQRAGRTRTVHMHYNSRSLT